MNTTDHQREHHNILHGPIRLNTPYCTVGQYLALLPCSKKGLGLTPFFVELICSPCVYIGFSGLSGFLLPHTQPPTKLQSPSWASRLLRTKNELLNLSGSFLVNNYSWTQLINTRMNYNKIILNTADGHKPTLQNTADEHYLNCRLMKTLLTTQSLTFSLFSYMD